MTSCAAPASPESILVVGGSGTIGQGLIEHLLSDTTQARSILSTYFRAPVPGWGPGDVRQLPLNLNDPTTIDALPTNVTALVLASGTGSLAACENDPEGSAQANVWGPIHLLKRMEPKTKVLVLSSHAVFSGDNVAYAETARPEPKSEYGRQKLLLETLAQEHHPNATILRLTKVLHPGHKTITHWIYSLKNGSPIEAFENAFISPIALSLVVKAIHSWLKGWPAPRQPIHLSAPDQISYLALARHLANLSGAPPDLVTGRLVSDQALGPATRYASLDCPTIKNLGLVPNNAQAVVETCVLSALRSKA